MALDMANVSQGVTDQHADAGGMAVGEDHAQAPAEDGGGGH